MGEFYQPQIRNLEAVVRDGPGSRAKLTSGQPEHPYLAPPPALMHDDASNGDAVKLRGTESKSIRMVSVSKTGRFGGLMPTFALLGKDTVVTASFGGGLAPRDLRRGLPEGFEPRCDPSRPPAFETAGQPMVIRGPARGRIRVDVDVH